MSQDKSPFFKQLWCKWGVHWERRLQQGGCTTAVKSSWYAWACPPGHSPRGSSTSFVSGAGGQECFSNVHMNKCSTMTFPHVRQEGDLQSTQLDSPNWHFDLTHLHKSHSIAGSCMFHCVQLEVSPTCEWWFDRSFPERLLCYISHEICPIHFSLKVNQTESIEVCSNIWEWCEPNSFSESSVWWAICW